MKERIKKKGKEVNSWRGCWAQFCGAFCNSEAQLYSSHVDFSGLAMHALTREHGVHHLVTIGFALKPLGQHLEKDVWWTLFWILHRIAWNKITWMFWGTWDSNPGPNAHWTLTQPLHQHLIIVSIIRSNYNIHKSINMLAK